MVQNDAQRPERVSDHDTPVSYFNFPQDTATSVTSSLDPSAFGEQVTFTATVTQQGAPVTTGAMVFKDGGLVLRTVPLNAIGLASFTTSTLSLGTHVITAEYSGSGNFAPSTGSFTQTVLTGVTIDDVTVSEGHIPGTVAAVFNVTLSTATAQTVVVNFATANETAIAGGDYVPRTGSLIFSPGVTTQTIAVMVNSDVLNEADESFFVNLDSATNAVIVDVQGVGTITDDDPLPGISINDVMVREVNTGTVNAVFTVRLTAASGRTVTADFTTIDDTPESPSDYVARSGTITFAPGVLSQTITVAVNGDLVTEANEIFAVSLSNLANANLVDGQGIATITNDDAMPSISIDDVTVTEPDSGSTAAVFTVSLSNPSQLTTLVRFRTVNGLALAGSDYEANSGTVVFAPGVLTQTISVSVLADSVTETAQMFFVSLATPTNATLRDALGIGLIYDAARPEITSFSPLTGTAGTSVMITGTDFTGVFLVRFGSINATFTVLSSTSIRATVPPGAVTGPISVVSLRGVGTSAMNFGVLPKITSFTPARAKAGAQVLIMGSGFGAGASVATSVQFGTGSTSTLTVVSPNLIRVNVPATATTGKIIVVTPAGTAISAATFTVLP